MFLLLLQLVEYLDLEKVSHQLPSSYRVTYYPAPSTFVLWWPYTGLLDKFLYILFICCRCCRLQLKCDGTRWHTGGEVNGKLANGVDSQYSSHYLGTWCIQHYYH